MVNRPQAALVAIAIALLGVSAAQAQTKSSGGREAFYRCKDGSGQTHYGDSMPSACAGYDTEVLNDNGMLVRLIEGDRTRAARLEREAVEGKARKEREARAQRDRTLIETYLTVADIERLRDQRLELLVSQYRITEQNIKNLRERQARLEQQIARFKPYSNQVNAPPLPDHLAEEMVNTVNGARVYAESLTKNKKEQAEVKSTFEADIKRFKELKGIK
jgi:DNA-binding transcriptional MerR regulator